MEPHVFVPFSKAPDVCDTCGELAEGHAGPVEWSQYREDLWKVLIQHGGILSTYGGYDEYETMVMSNHLGIEAIGNRQAYLSTLDTQRYKDYFEPSKCGIEYAKSVDPHPDTFGEFRHSFTGSSNWVDVVSGILDCKCGAYRYTQVGIRDKTLGQLIWLIAHAGD